MGTFLPLPGPNVAIANPADGTPTTTWYTWFQTLFGGGASWKDFTITTAASGGGASTATGSGRFFQFGKAVFIRFEITFSAVTTPGYVFFANSDLPVPPNSSFYHPLAGFNIDNFLPAEAVIWTDGFTYAKFTDAASGNLAYTGSHTAFSGVYEAA